jgi:hypothetical protein
MDEKELIETGQANHIHNDNSVSTVIVNVLIDDNPTGFIALNDGEDSILIHSRDQWRQIVAFVEQAFSALED